MKRTYEALELSVIEITDVITTSTTEKPGITLPEHEFDNFEGLIG